MLAASRPMANYVAAGLAAAVVPVVLWDLWRIVTRWPALRRARSPAEVHRRALGEKGHTFVAIYYVCIGVAIVATLPFLE